MSTCAIGALRVPTNANGSPGSSLIVGNIVCGDNAGSIGSNCVETGKDACNLQVDHSRVSTKRNSQINHFISRKCSHLASPN